jgi:ribonuclease G
MSKELCISSTPHETRLAIVEDDQLTEIYYERENEYTLAGSIYKGRVTRVLPGMQSAFVDIGLERDAFLYVTDFLEEAGESADFERPQQSNGQRQPREAQAPREAREPRGPRPPREVAEPRIALDPEASIEAAPNGEAAAAPSDEFDQGTRRWRGRRGRRRGFRGGQREGTPTPATTPEQGVEAYFQNEVDQPLEDLSGISLSAQAEVAADAPSPSRNPRRDHGRRDGRNESRRESRPETRYESRNESAPPPSGTPIVLPGESLSKYGQKAPAIMIEIEAVDRSEEKPLPVYTTAAPSTLVEESALVWDGVSAALPGESLSRYRNRPTPQPVQPQTKIPHTEAVSNDYASVTDFTSTVTDELTHEQTRTSAPMEILHAINTPGGVTFEDVYAHTAPPAIPEEIITAQHPAPLVEEVAEVEEFEEEEIAEPEHASASYRVDPTAPSEFRLASPVEEAPAEQHQYPSEDKLEATAAFFEHREEAIQEAAHYEFEHQHEAAPEQAAAEQPTPEFEIHGTFQAEAAPETEPHSSPEESSEATPLEHLHAFAPGSGLIEEEVIDEEEYDFTPLHGHADDHDLEEIEEETLDSASVGAELGDFVRDEHIKRRVMGESDPDEEDFDEDSSEESYAENGEELESSLEESEDEVQNGHAHGLEIEHQDSDQPAAASSTQPQPRRDENRRPGRDNGRGGRRGNGQRGRSGGHRQSAQMSDLPIISDLLKQGQEVLVQIAKEPIAKKGARITSHIALPGRFLVFMPTVNHVGVSRKISSDEERHRLKRVLTSEKGTAPGGFIVRTAADGASEEELRADLRFLISLWTEIKTRSDNGKAPALIYHDLNLVERVLRDQVSDNFSTIWVDSEVEYERIVRFLNRFEPSLVRRVKLYTKETPLFEHFGIQEEISKALKSKVWLKSGGSIVINQTEALVAIDINTGKYVGKTARLEDTIVKTNLDAIPEIVRQIRLRDLGGIIIIDFIDMDERKNRNRVMQALEDELKTDRAPSKVLQFNDFGLVAITRKRVKQSLERTLSTQCNICAGTGMVKSPATVCNEIYTELRKMMKHFERGDVLLRVHPEIVKTLKQNNGKWLTELEEMIGRTIMIKSDPALHPEQFDIH